MIRILTEDSEGVLELRGGVVDDAKYGDLTGDAALERLFGLDAGLYELAQTLPTFDGDLGDGAQCWGNLEDVPLAQVMRHCEDHALSCTVVVVSEFDRGEIVYDTGDIAAVALNGVVDEDAIVTITQWATGKFRMTAPPLKLDIEGWPVVSGQPTAPFQVEHLAARPRQRFARGSTSPPVRRTTLPGMPVAEATPSPKGKGRVPPSRRKLERTVADAAELAVSTPSPTDPVTDLVVDDEPPDVLIDDREWRVKPNHRAPSVIEIEAELPPDDDNYYTDPEMDLSWQPTRIRPPTEDELSAATPAAIDRPVIELPPRRPAAIGRAETEPDADLVDDLLSATTEPEREPVVGAAFYDMDDFSDAASPMRADTPLPYHVDPSPSASFELAPPPRTLRMATSSAEWTDSSGAVTRVFATLLFLMLAAFGAFYFLTYF